MLFPAVGWRMSQGVGTSTPQIKVGEDVYRGKTEPIVGTTMAFVTPKAGSSGGGSVFVSSPFALMALIGSSTDRLLEVNVDSGYIP